MSHPGESTTHASWYTVVGVYTDNWQKFCDHALAVDPQQAEDLIRNNPEYADDLAIVAVFEGKLTVVDQQAFADVRH